jgi:hypothetical protein
MVPREIQSSGTSAVDVKEAVQGGSGGGRSVERSGPSIEWMTNAGTTNIANTARASTTIRRPAVIAIRFLAKRQLAREGLPHNVKVHRARAINPSEAQVSVARAPVQPLVRRRGVPTRAET